MPLLYMLIFTLYYERIIFAEEMFLRREFGQAYLDWAATTRLAAFFGEIMLDKISISDRYCMQFWF